jgi:hypothetical protein
MSERNQVVDGVDLSKLTADQLISLTADEWDEVKTVFEAAVKAKAAEEWVEFKANVKAYLNKVETYYFQRRQGYVHRRWNYSDMFFLKGTTAPPSKLLGQ